MRNEALYQRIAARLEKQIANGSLRPGERIPSVRKMSRQERVSVSTVLEAYLQLEARELIEAKPQSGFYVRCGARPGVPEPGVIDAKLGAQDVQVADLVNTIFAAGSDRSMVAFGTASPAPELLPLARLNRLYREVLRDNPEHSARYDYAPGLPALRRQIARHSRNAGLTLTGDDVLLTCGALEALTLALRAVTKPGDAVVVEGPTYFGILQVLESLSLTAVEVPAHPRTGVDPEAVEAALRRCKKITAGVFMPTFHNPLGCVIPDDAKQALVTLFRRHKLPLIEDDVYGDLPHAASRPAAIKKFDEDGGVLLCSSFSKTLSPGMRLGWIAPGRYRDRVLQLKQMSSIASPSLPALALARYLEGESYERHLRRMRSALAVQLARAAQLVSSHFPEGTKVSRPQGGFVLWVELPENVDTLQLFRKALRKKIGMSPGQLFSAHGHFKHCLRLNCGLLWNDKAENALAELGKIAG